MMPVPPQSVEYTALPKTRVSPPLLSGRETLLEGSVLGLPGLIEQKPAEQAGSRPSGRTEPGVPTDRPGDGADTGPSGGAGQRALLSWGHIGASGDRQNDGREQEQLVHGVPQKRLISEIAGRGNVRSGT